MIWQNILVVVIALLGFPAGLLIARMTKEELKAGKKWFKMLIALSIVGIIISVIFARAESMLLLIAAFVFISLLSLAALIYPRVRNDVSRARRK